MSEVDLFRQNMINSWNSNQIDFGEVSFDTVRAVADCTQNVVVLTSAAVFTALKYRKDLETYFTQAMELIDQFQVGYRIQHELEETIAAIDLFALFNNTYIKCGVVMFGGVAKKDLWRWENEKWVHDHLLELKVWRV